MHYEVADMGQKIKFIIYVFCVIVFVFCEKKTVEGDTIFFSDKTSTLDPSYIKDKNEYLKNLKQNLNIDIRVLVVHSTVPHTIEDFSVAAFDQYKIGGDLNNGILVLLATEDRKLRITTGTGIELVVPDDIAAHIIKEMVVYLRQAELENAINIAIERLFDKANSVSWTIERNNIERISSNDLNKVFEFQGEYISKEKTLEPFSINFRTNFFAKVKVKNRNVLVFENQYLKNMRKLEKSKRATMLVRLVSLDPETYQLLNIK